MSASPPRWQRYARYALSGTVLAIAGLVVAVIALPPKGWVANAQEWAHAVWAGWPYLASAGVGLALGAGIVAALGTSGPRNFLLAGDQYVTAFRECIESREFSVVRIFGYTGEVVGNDLIHYLDRYRSDIELRLLQRNWLAEMHDEEEHNDRASALGLRLWEKSSTIRERAVTPWSHALRRDVRFYMHQPILTGAVFTSPRHNRRVAFVGFLRWEPEPETGGSQFKSVPSIMIKVDSDDGTAANEFIGRMISQFEYEWRKALPLASVLAQEGTLETGTSTMRTSGTQVEEDFES